MRTVGYRGTIGLVQEVAGGVITVMPPVVNQRCRARPEVVHVLVHRIELVRNGLTRELQHPATEPALGTAQPALLTRNPVDHSWPQLIRKPRRRDGRISQE